jgi:CBS domain-containing protein
MTRQVREVMTDAPLAVGVETSVAETARLMREQSVGVVLVMAGEQLHGLVTDRDLVVRAAAEGGDPGAIPVRMACSEQLATIGPDEPLGRAVELMRQGAVRRLPVVDGGRPVGIVSLGDLAVERDPGSALGEISTARPND